MPKVIKEPWGLSLKESHEASFPEETRRREREAILVYVRGGTGRMAFSKMTE